MCPRSYYSSPAAQRNGRPSKLANKHALGARLALVYTHANIGRYDVVYGMANRCLETEKPGEANRSRTERRVKRLVEAYA